MESPPADHPPSSVALHAVLDALDDGVLIFAADWRIVAINRVAEMLLGIPRADLVDHTLGHDVLVLDAERLAVYRDVMHDRHPRPVPGVRLERPGSAEQIFEGDVRPVPDGGILVCFHDVTRFADATQRADAARAAAEHAHEAEREVFATLSHEIRSPLHAIVGYTELVEVDEMGSLSAAQRGHLEHLRTSAAHLLDLISSVLERARAGVSHAMPAPQHVRASVVVAAALTLVRPQAVTRGITLVDACATEQAVSCMGDPQHIRQILVNLLANAIKFTAPGGRVSTRCALVAEAGSEASVLSAAHGPWVRVDIEDTGVGIAATQLEQIFERFVQVGADDTSAHAGVGLGLAVSRDLARAMGGDLTVRSAQGVGSTFSLWLPSAAEAPPISPSSGPPSF